MQNPKRRGGKGRQGVGVLIALLPANPIRAAPALGFVSGGVCICHMPGEIPQVRAEGNTTVSG